MKILLKRWIEVRSIPMDLVPDLEVLRHCGEFYEMERRRLVILKSGIFRFKPGMRCVGAI